ncbi:MAG: hypothetical protein KTR19_03455 [Hyphomicrobiales bacterium]|nr:hypothetical protein [Hyphomicrobiales bacterium]
MKFFRTIRFDPSDSFVFEHAAEPEEWAIPGGFAFSDAQETDLAGKRKQAFSNGFLSLESFGHATFVSVTSIEEAQIAILAERLAGHFVDRYHAPSLAAALPAARDEIRFTQDLCRQAPINAVFTLRRYFDDQGEIREAFHMVEQPGEKLHSRIWDVVED